VSTAGLVPETWELTGDDARRTPDKVRKSDPERAREPIAIG
jgi:hypothetical protein